MRIINLILILIVLNIAAFSQGELFYDGTINYKTAVIKPDVRAILESGVLPKVSEQFKPDAKCIESFDIPDGAAISDYEKVYLYNYSCGDLLITQGMAFVDHGQVTAIFAFKSRNIKYDHIFHRNGLAVLGGKGTSGFKTFNVVSAINWAYPLTATGEAAETTFITSEICDGDCRNIAKKIYYEAGDGYFFSTEDYRLQDNQWVKTSARKSDDDGDLHQIDQFKVVMKFYQTTE